MNDIKDLEIKLFSHLKPEEQIPPINKRRKLLRRLQRKEERLLAIESDKLELDATKGRNEDIRPGSLWDVKEIPPKNSTSKNCAEKKNFIGPKKPTMYTIKDNKIMRLELVKSDHLDSCEDYQAVDIVLPVNAAEGRLLEGTKLCLDDIKKIERFKDYEPGVPSKVYKPVGYLLFNGNLLNSYSYRILFPFLSGPVLEEHSSYSDPGAAETIVCPVYPRQ